MLLTDVYHPPVWGSLAAIAVILATAVVFSLRAKPSLDQQHDVAILDTFGLVTQEHEADATESAPQR